MGPGFTTLHAPYKDAARIIVLFMKTSVVVSFLLFSLFYIRVPAINQDHSELLFLSATRRVEDSDTIGSHRRRSHSTHKRTFAKNV